MPQRYNELNWTDKKYFARSTLFFDKFCMLSWPNNQINVSDS